MRNGNLPLVSWAYEIFILGISYYDYKNES